MSLMLAGHRGATDPIAEHRRSRSWDVKRSRVRGLAVHMCGSTYLNRMIGRALDVPVESAERSRVGSAAKVNDEGMSR